MKRNIYQFNNQSIRKNILILISLLVLSGTFFYHKYKKPMVALLEIDKTGQMLISNDTIYYSSNSILSTQDSLNLVLLSNHFTIILE